jgi:hypothetical protein
VSDSIGIRTNRIVHTFADGAKVVYLWDLNGDGGSRQGWLYVPSGSVRAHPLLTENPEQLHQWLGGDEDGEQEV